MPRPNRLRLTLSAVAILLVVATLLKFCAPDLAPHASPSGASTDTGFNSGSAAALGGESIAPDGTPPPAQPIPPDPALLTTIRSLRNELQTGLSREDTLARIAVIKQQVHDLPPETAAATLIALLESGEDSPTGLGFVVGDDGVLAEAPTYRVALIDLLGQTEPDAIVGYSRTLLDTTPRPDEYAVALRNLAWLDHEGSLTRELSTRFSALLDRSDWRAAPSTGYLEAFDIAVAVGGNGMVTELASVLQLTAEQPALNRAAFVALDRIALREPQTLAAIVTADPTFLDFAPDHRASLIARLDPASPAEQAALRSYLLSTPAGGEEITYFAKIFPNPNFFDSHRLVTPWEPITDTASRRDEAALVFIDTLLAEPAYATHSASLQSIRARLQSFAPAP
jgi:hypothetical protein